MENNTGQSWKECFDRWPKGIPRGGVLVTTLNEQIPFNDFLTSDSMLLLQRTMPDTSGARKILVPFSNISIMKLVTVVKSSAFEPLGFQGKMQKE
jgi:hypothetical protein